MRDELADVPRVPPPRSRRCSPTRGGPDASPSQPSHRYRDPIPRERAVIALEARDLSVEVAGRIVVEGLTIDLRDGDKVGVVGRNGAGKTSTLRVLAGEMPPASGTVTRRGAVGYLRQDPRQHRADDEDRGLEHILAAR